MTASTRSRLDLSAGRKSRMPRGGLTDATDLFFQVGLGIPDLGLETAETNAQGALRVPSVGAGGADEREERVAEFGLGGRCFDPGWRRGDLHLGRLAKQLLRESERRHP